MSVVRYSGVLPRCRAGVSSAVTATSPARAKSVYVEEKGVGCESHAHRRNHTVSAERERFAARRQPRLRCAPPERAAVASPDRRSGRRRSSGQPGLRVRTILADSAAAPPKPYAVLRPGPDDCGSSSATPSTP